MKTFKKEVKEVFVTDMLTCNKCGQKQDVSDTNDGECVEVNHTFGYSANPNLFGDMTFVSFDLCERCVFELVKTFAVPAYVIIPH